MNKLPIVSCLQLCQSLRSSGQLPAFCASLAYLLRNREPASATPTRVSPCSQRDPAASSCCRTGCADPRCARPGRQGPHRPGLPRRCQAVRGLPACGWCRGCLSSPRTRDSSVPTSCWTTLHGQGSHNSLSTLVSGCVTGRNFRRHSRTGKTTSPSRCAIRTPWKPPSIC